MVRVNIEINDELHKKAKLSALVQNMTIKEYIWKAVEDKIKSNENKK